MQLLSQFFLHSDMLLREIISHTCQTSPLSQTHTRTHELARSSKVFLHPYLLLPHAIKSKRTPVLAAQNRLIVTSDVSSSALIEYLEVHLLHHKEIY